MQIERQRAVVDADFFIKLTKYDDRNATLFQKIMDELDFQPVMHDYVAHTEIESFPEIDQLIRDRKIIVLKDKDFITDENREDYEEYFVDAFLQMNKYPCPDGEDLYTYSCEDESLGEIRSVFLAKAMRYPLFMSDDGNAKRLAERNSTSKQPLATWNIYETLKRCKDRGTSIRLKLLNPTIANVFRDRQDMLKELQRLYGE